MALHVSGVGLRVQPLVATLLASRRMPQAAPLAPSSAPVSAGASSLAAASPSTIVSLGTRAAAAPLPVDYTDRIKRSGNKQIDPLLAGGNHWFHASGASGAQPSAAARKELSFSFVESSAGMTAQDANGFRALGTEQRERVRTALSYLSELIDVKFTEVASGGDLSYGTNTQTQSAGYATYPGEGSRVMLANNQGDSSWEQGSYGWQTLLHETAHALGLKHPGNYNAGGGGTPGPYLAKSADHADNTIMSYTAAAGSTKIVENGGAFQKAQVNADSYQAFDIAALQYLYGAARSTAAKTYTIGADREAFSTLWNPNAGSTIDLSARSDRNVLDLRAGKKSAIGLRDAYADMSYSKDEYAKLASGGRKLTSLVGRPNYTGQGNLAIAAGSQFTRAIGGSGADSIVGNTAGGSIDGGAGDDQIYWSGGDLAATGGAGFDTLNVKKVAGAAWALSADKTQLTLTKTDRRTGVVSTLSTVSLSGIESVRFWNGNTLKSTGAELYAVA